MGYIDHIVWAGMASLVAMLVVGGRGIRWMARQGWIQPTRYEDCPPLQPIQQSKQGTPTMGGLIVLAVAAAVAAWSGALARPEGRMVLVTMIGLGLIGAVDDLVKLSSPNAGGLRCRPKLLAALGIGGVMGWLLSDPSLGYRSIDVPWMATQVDVGLWWIPLAMVVVAGSAHAVNLTDGMDGLASGCLAIVFAAFGLMALFNGTQDPLSSSRVVGIWSASLAGACAGFLWFNGFPASVFLGDVGALGLGGALGVLALVGHAALVLLVLGGVFVAEAGSVILQVASYRFRNKRRIFRVAPLHHHVQLGGVPEPKLVVRFWIISALLAAVALSAVGPR